MAHATAAALVDRENDPGVRSFRSHSLDAQICFTRDNLARARCSEVADILGQTRGLEVAGGITADSRGVAMVLAWLIRPPALRVADDTDRGPPSAVNDLGARPPDSTRPSRMQLDRATQPTTFTRIVRDAGCAIVLWIGSGPVRGGTPVTPAVQARMIVGPTGRRRRNAGVAGVDEGALANSRPSGVPLERATPRDPHGGVQSGLATAKTDRLRSPRGWANAARNAASACPAAPASAIDLRNPNGLRILRCVHDNAARHRNKLELDSGKSSRPARGVNRPGKRSCAPDG